MKHANLGIINKNKKYEFYSISSLGVVFFLPKLSEHSTRNIRDYTRLNQGDWWIYADNYGREISVEVSGLKRIKGIDIPIMKASDGSESHRNFDGTFLKIFGEAIHNDRYNIDFLYEPPISLGDDKLNAGKNYPNNNFKEVNSGINGLSLLCRWDGLEDLILPKGTLMIAGRLQKLEIMEKYLGGMRGELDKYNLNTRVKK